MLIRAFITHKEAEYYIDCQDRFSINLDSKSIALSDGMSQSIFQKYWAEILVNAYTSDTNWYPNISSVRKLSPLWREKVNEYVKNQKKEGKNPWRVERNLSDGLSAGATFLGIRFDRNTWSCQILGDSCLVLIREGQITDIISSENASSFNNYPDYYDSHPQKEGKGKLKDIRGQLSSNCAILLVTDPFSDFLKRKSGTEEEKSLIHQLLHIETHEEYESVVEEWRKMGMHNDDSTLIVILPDGSDIFDIKLEDDIFKLIECEKSEIESSLNQTSSSIFKIDFNANEQKEKLIDSIIINSKEIESEEIGNYFNISKLNHLLNNEFSNKLERCIISNLNIGDLYSRKRKKETAKKIALEIRLLINNTLTKE